MRVAIGLFVFGAGLAGGCTGEAPEPPGEQPDPGNQSGSMTGWCCDCGVQTALARDEVGAGGFTAEDAAAGVASLDGIATWIDGAVSGIHVGIALDEESVGNIVWIDAQEGDCEPFLRVPVWLDVSTDDGALAETQRADLWAYEVGRGRTGADWHAAFLAGDIDLTRFAAGATRENAILYAFVEVPGGGAPAGGTIEMNPQNEAGTTGWSGAQPIATWTE